jgi:hypothetical protein
MTENQKKALAHLEAIGANAICFPTTGWIWRDDIRRLESVANFFMDALRKLRAGEEDGR